ncbi:MAG: type II toxin-antitoxin system RelE/ParE family toxin [Candidatus Aenigmarchaeota archaeon]|nr:type II toxin-antitoxin system RelE/ParE family toxin [Candidatus Aenigmarchaeota archaeon]
MVYNIETTDTFEREFEKKHRDKVAWLKKIKDRLKENPEYGKPLRSRLHGIWQIRIGPFRVWYEINHVEKKVILKAILHKDEAIEYY